MIEKIFNEFAKSKFSNCINILIKKAANNPGYSSKKDRLSHFKIAGEVQDITPERACLGMAVKHFISIREMLYSLDNPSNIKNINKEIVDEKMGDYINYMIFIWALLYERIEEFEEISGEHKHGN